MPTEDGGRQNGRKAGAWNGGRREQRGGTVTPRMWEHQDDDVEQRGQETTDRTKDVLVP